LNPNSIELPAEEMRRIGYRTIDLIVDHLANLAASSTGHKAVGSELGPLFEFDPPEQPAGFDAALATVVCDVLRNTVHVNHPRFFAFVPGPGNYVGVLADAIAAGFNVFNGTWFAGSGAAALELGVLDWLRRCCGMPEGTGGLFVSGGSVANMSALAVARRAVLNDRIADATVYFSDQTHSSVERALRILGFLPEQFRPVASDDAFHLPMPALEHAVLMDRAAGLHPFSVVANAGTTNTGAIDPLPELVEYTRREGMWLHVDGAYGAAAAVSERGRALLEGMGGADSLSLDPHKWLFQPFECGCFLVRDGRLMKETFQIMPDYLQDVHRYAEVHPCDYGIQLTREFRALKLWLSLQVFGVAAFRAAIEHGFEMAELAERTLRERGWVIESPAQMGIVCFRRHGGLDELHLQLVQAMLDDGFAALTSTNLRGRVVLRMCTINPRTTAKDIEDTVDRLERFLCSPGEPAS
jgi:glutamate/tyrosine decarboxylase-like PLP-dependent enzyme